MTSEDWQTLMMSTVRATDASAVFFFLVWILVSKYVFLMLFLAVAMEAFERSYQEMEPELTTINVAPPIDPDICPSVDPEEARRSLLSTMAEAFTTEAQFRQSIVWSAGCGSLQRPVVAQGLRDAGEADHGRLVPASAAVGKQARVPGLDLTGVAVAPGGRIAEPGPAVAALPAPEASTLVSGSYGTRERITGSTEVACASFSVGGAVCESQQNDSMALQDAEEKAIDAWLAGPQPAAGSLFQKAPAAATSGQGQSAGGAAHGVSEGGFLQRVMQGDGAAVTGEQLLQAAGMEAPGRSQPGLSLNESQWSSGVVTSSESVRSQTAAGLVDRQVASAGCVRMPGADLASEHVVSIRSHDGINYSSGTSECCTEEIAADVGERTATGALGYPASMDGPQPEGDGSSQDVTAAGQAGSAAVSVSSASHAVRRIVVGHDSGSQGPAGDAAGADDPSYLREDTVVAPLPTLSVLPVPHIAQDGSFVHESAYLESMLLARNSQVRLCVN